MAYERYPRDAARDDQSGNDYRRSYGGDGNRASSNRDDQGYGGQPYGGSRDDQSYGAQRYGAARDPYNQRDDAGNGQRGYYDASDRNERNDNFSGYNVGASSNVRSYRQSYGQDRHRGDRGGAEMYRGQRAPADYDYTDRGFLNRAGDEVRSWFGDDEAERRREMDQQHDQRYARGDARDEHYHNWRRGQIAALDRDYDEYRRENQQRFHTEFGSWRNDRQGQRSSLSKVAEHMDVVGSDGAHVGTVDKVRGDRILLTKNDADAGGHHHSIPSRWIDTVDDKVTLRKSADEAKAAWRDEERGDGKSAFFGDDDTDDSGRILNRSFSGTY